MGTLRKSYPRFKREGAAQRIQLTNDDIAILRHVYRHRFVRADDLYRLFADRSPDKLSRRLTRLYRNHFLDRPIAQVNRFRDGGSQAMVYGLDNAGARFIKETFGVSINSADWKARNRSYTRENLDHTLSVSQFLINLELACGAREGVSLIPFDEILADSPDKTRRLLQPGRWPVEVLWAGSRADIYIIPDAIFGLRTPGPEGRPTRTYVFLEIDRGTMTIVPAKQTRENDGFLYRATILRKLLTYGESYRQELHKAHFGIPAARVLTLTTSAPRAEAMRVAAQKLITEPLRLPPGLFLFGVQAGGDPLGMSLLNSVGTPAPLVRYHN